MLETLVYYIVTVVLITILGYFYSIRNFGYWRQFHLSGPKPVPIFGTMLYKLKTPLNLLDIQWHHKFGPLYGTFLGSEPVLTVAKPELIRKILITDFQYFTDRRHLLTEHPIINQNLFFVLGNRWRRIRNLVSPALSNNKIKAMQGSMKDCIENVMKFIDKTIADKEEQSGDSTKNGVELNVKILFGNLTMDVIARTVFASRIESNIDSSNLFVLNARKFFDIKWYRYFPMFWLPKNILKLLMSSQFDENANQFFINISRQLLLNRRKYPGRYNDLVQLLADSRLNTGDENCNEKLTDDEILAQCWVIFLAGYETTASTLSYCLAELAQNSTIQSQLYQELKTLSGINFDNLKKSTPYLKAVINETLRKYPPIVRLERTCSIDYELDENIHLKAGQVVEIPVYAIHHDEEYYPEPETFRPERFLSNESRQQSRSSMTFLPFGQGPRNCVGMQFAMMELKLVLAYLVTNYSFGIGENTEFPLKFEPITPFLYNKSNILIVKKRNQ